MESDACSAACEGYAFRLTQRLLFAVASFIGDVYSHGESAMFSAATTIFAVEDRQVIKGQQGLYKLYETKLIWVAAP
jgi:hypothetical protein